MKDFLETILDNIIAGVDQPKVQVERQISPFLDVFIESIVSSSPHTSELFKLVGGEFPIETESEQENLMATNIDYLMVNEANDHLLLVELKTDSKSFKLEQYEIYKSIVAKIEHESAQFLYDFLYSLSHKKYKNYRDSIDNDNIIQSQAWSKIRRASIIYITPEDIKSKAKRWGDAKRNAVDEIMFIHFKDFPEKMETFPESWSLIRQKILILDRN